MIRAALDLLPLVVLANIAFVVLVGGALLRQARRSARRMGRHLERRAVDIVLVWLGFTWLTGRHQRTHQQPAAPRPPVLEGDEIYRACTISAWTGDPAACRWCNRLLPVNKPRFCRARCSREATFNHVFSGPGGARAVAIARDRDQCRRCGSPDDLQVHHVRAIHGRHEQPGCHHHLAGLVTLCAPCHQIETNAQRAAGEFGPALPRWTS